tara:strand:+ start:3988 stop:5745 length:1758 start_codon:yes stop_codon:yes gene_type:complete
MADKKVVIQVEIKGTGIGALDKEMAGAKKAADNLAGGLDGAKAAADGTKRGIQGINVALKAAGIGLVLSAIALSVQVLMGAWNMMTDALMRNKDVSEAYEKITKGVVEVVDKFTTAIVDFYIAVYTDAEKFPEIAKQLNNWLSVLVTGIETMENSIYLVKDAFDLWYAAVKQIWSFDFNFDEIKEKAADLGGTMLKQFGLVAKQAGNAKDIIEQYPNQFKEATGAVKDLVEEFEEIVEETDLMKTKTKDQLDAEAKALAKLIELRKKEREIRIQSEKDMYELFFKLRHENTLNEIEADKGKRQRALSTASFQMNQEKRRIEDSLVNEKKKEQLLKQLAEKFKNDQAAINKTFDDAEETKRLTEAQKLLDVQNETTLMLIQSLEERALKELEIQRDKELASVESHDNFKAMEQAINEKYEAKKAKVIKKNLDKELKWEEMTAGQKLGIASNTAGNLSKIMGEETAAGKAFAVTQATIDTYRGATGAYAALSGLGPAGPVLGAIAAAAAVASGLANVKAILSAGSGAPPADNSPTGGGVQGPAPQMMSGAFEISEFDEPEPVKAFVVTDEMTNSQDQLANIRRKSTI